MSIPFFCRAVARETSIDRWATGERCFGVTLPPAVVTLPRRCNASNSWTWSFRQFCAKLRKSCLFQPMLRSLTNTRHVSADRLLLSVIERGFGVRLLRSRILHMYLAALQLVVSIRPQCDLLSTIAERRHGPMTFKHCLNVACCCTICTMLV